MSTESLKPRNVLNIREHCPDFVQLAEIKVCLECGIPYTVDLRVCPKCGRIHHTRTHLQIETWKVLPPGIGDDRHNGPAVRVTNFGNSLR